MHGHVYNVSQLTKGLTVNEGVKKIYLREYLEMVKWKILPSFLLGTAVAGFTVGAVGTVLAFKLQNAFAILAVVALLACFLLAYTIKNKISDIKLEQYSPTVLVDCGILHEAGKVYMRFRGIQDLSGECKLLSRDQVFQVALTLQANDHNSDQTCFLGFMVPTSYVEESLNLGTVFSGFWSQTELPLAGYITAKLKELGFSKSHFTVDGIWHKDSVLLGTIEV